MKFKSQVYTSVSGSVGGLTYSRNAGGMYTRGRAVPVNPSTPQQQAVRNSLSALTSDWSNTLTAPQRDGWTTYAANVPLKDSLGDARLVSPIAQFLRANVSRLQAGLTQVNAAPLVYTLASLSPVTVTGVASTGVITVTYDNSDVWAGAVGGALLVYVSRPQSVGKVFFDGPYRYAGRINGAATPPTSPGTVTSPFALGAGQKVFVRVVATNADGRLSADQRLTFSAT